MDKYERGIVAPEHDFGPAEPSFRWADVSAFDGDQVIVITSGPSADELDRALHHGPIPVRLKFRATLGVLGECLRADTKQRLIRPLTKGYLSLSITVGRHTPEAWDARGISIIGSVAENVMLVRPVDGFDWPKRRPLVGAGTILRVSYDSTARCGGVARIGDELIVDSRCELMRWRADTALSEDQPDYFLIAGVAKDLPPRT